MCSLGGFEDWLRKVIEKRMEVKYKERLSTHHEVSARVLNRVVSSTGGNRVRSLPETRGNHHQRCGIEGHSKGVSTPGVNEDGGGADEEEANETMYRAIAARADYLAQDRSDIKFGSE